VAVLAPAIGQAELERMRRSSKRGNASSARMRKGQRRIVSETGVVTYAAKERPPARER
jgi:hypothetical protein